MADEMEGVSRQVRSVPVEEADVETVSLLNREDILAADDHSQEVVHVPEWGGNVLVGTMGGKDRDAWELMFVEERGKSRPGKLQNIRAALVARTVVDCDGKRLFTDADVEALGEKNANTLNRVFLVARRINRLTDEDIKEQVGNSNGDRSEGSGSN